MQKFYVYSTIVSIQPSAYTQRDQTTDAFFLFIRSRLLRLLFSVFFRLCICTTISIIVIHFMFTLSDKCRERCGLCCLKAFECISSIRLGLFVYMCVPIAEPTNAFDFLVNVICAEWRRWRDDEKEQQLTYYVFNTWWKMKKKLCFIRSGSSSCFSFSVENLCALRWKTSCHIYVWCYWIRLINENDNDFLMVYGSSHSYFIIYLYTMFIVSCVCSDHRATSTSIYHYSSAFHLFCDGKER